MLVRFDRILVLATLAFGARGEARSLPVMFEPNMGQAGPGTLFLGRGAGSVIQFDARGISLLSGQSTVRMNLRGASSNVRVRGNEPLAGKANYFVGKQDEWVTDIPLYGGVRYEDVYPGIGLVFYSNGGDLEYDFSLAPGAAPSTIGLSFSGIDSMRIEGGDLVLKTDSGELRHRRPHIYQQRNGHRVEVKGRFVIRGPGEAGFETDEYDAQTPLVIDPVMAYATFVGGSGSDMAWAVAVDSAGCAYVAGETYPVNFPRTLTISNSTGNQDAFLVKMNPAGTAVLYATYFGGSGRDSARGVAVDSAGNAYVTGFTYSPNFPVTTGAYSSPSLGLADTFAIKVNAGGTAVVYSALLGGSGNDFATGIAIDGAGDAYISGYTSSVDLPVTAGVVQPFFGGNFQDGFVAKLNPAGSGLVYSTYLGGSGNDVANGIAVDPLGSAYVAGYTDSINFPIRNALQASGGGQGDGFLTKLSPAGDALVFSTYLGGSQSDSAAAVALDSLGNVYVTGSTVSADFPVTGGAFQTVNRGSYDAFVVELNPQGSAMIYSTYLGGEGADHAASIAVDANGVAYIAGYTYSSQFPVGSAVQGAARGGQDAFVTAIGAGGTSLVWSTYLGGGGDDQATGIAVDHFGGAFVVGSTFSAGFPTTPAAYRTVYAGGDGFLVKLAPSVPRAVSVAPSSGSGLSQIFAYTVSSTDGSSYIAGVYTLFNTSIGALSACHLFYNPAANLIYLIDDVGGFSFAPAVLGTGGSRSNSQCTLDVGASSAATSGNSLTLNLALSFSPSWAGLKNNYLYVTDRGGRASGWAQVGTWTGTVPGPPPVAVAATPASGIGPTQTFAYTVSSASGASYVAGIYTLFNTAISATNACHTFYNPSANLVYLIGDSGGFSLPPAVLGTAGSRSNSQCTLDTGASSASVAGNSLTLNLVLSFNSGWSGIKNNYLWVSDRSGQSSGWAQVGTWTVSATTPPPVAVAVSPASGIGPTQTFAYTVSSASGGSYVAGIYTLFNTVISAVNACHTFYNPSANLIYLIDDAGSFSLPPAVLGTVGSRSNSQCTLDAGASSVSVAGSSLTLRLALSFTPGWSGAKNNYLWVSDRSNQSSGWAQVGTWTVSATTPPPVAVAVTPASGIGPTQTFAYTVSSASGGSYVAGIYTLFNTVISAVNACHTFYNPSANLIYLIDDAGSFSLPPAVLGTAGSRSNSQCTLDTGASSVSVAGSSLTLRLALTFTPGWSGAKNNYLWVSDRSNQSSGWAQVGTWTP